VFPSLFAMLLSVMKNDTKNTFALNKEQASAFMKLHGIYQAVLEFDGSGDDGQITCAELVGNDNQELFNQKVTVWKTIHKYAPEGAEWLTETVSEELHFSDLLEHIAYDCLATRFGGWEINSGSFGVITIKKDGTGSIEFNERIETTEYSESTF